MRTLLSDPRVALPVPVLCGARVSGSRSSGGGEGSKVMCFSIAVVHCAATTEESSFFFLSMMDRLKGFQLLSIVGCFRDMFMCYAGE